MLILGIVRYGFRTSSFCKRTDMPLQTREVVVKLLSEMLADRNWLYSQYGGVAFVRIDNSSHCLLGK